jgi:RsmE family RNA methyltransferase
VNVLLLAPDEIGADGVVVLSPPHAAHVGKVLKVPVGHSLRVGVIDGPMGTGTVTAIAGDRVELRCTFEPAIPARPRVDVLLALPRPKVMRRLWAQLAALGVGQVILTNAEKVERDYFDSHVLQPEGYRPLLIEGLQQARDTRVPIVSIHKRFKVLVEDGLDALFPSGRRIVAHPSAVASTSSTLAGVNANERVLVAIGPEGGWNDFEVNLLVAHGFQPAGMGPRTLATTTACVALLAVVHEALRKSDSP